ncbi:MAG: DeoR family transcriptional regulator [Paludibacteraceae bacterium]|nr:DeoR family transcriptional regulator [Paludibacteraceae bacterium]
MNSTSRKKQLCNVVLSERQIRIVDLIHNEQINSTSISAMLGVSEITARRELNTLREMGIIRRVGSRKTGHWEVAEEKKDEHGNQ